MDVYYVQKALFSTHSVYRRALGGRYTHSFSPPADMEPEDRGREWFVKITQLAKAEIEPSYAGPYSYPLLSLPTFSLSPRT